MTTCVHEFSAIEVDDQADEVLVKCCKCGIEQTHVRKSDGGAEVKPNSEDALYEIERFARSSDVTMGHAAIILDVLDELRDLRTKAAIAREATTLDAFEVKPICQHASSFVQVYILQNGESISWCASCGATQEEGDWFNCAEYALLKLNGLRVTKKDITK